MATFLSICIVSLVLCPSLSTALAAPTAPPGNGGLIREACKASKTPPSCETSLSQATGGPPSGTLMDTIKLAIWVSQTNVKTTQTMVNDILAVSRGNLNRTNAAKTCVEVLNYSDYRSNMTVAALATGKINKDTRAWMSAAMVYQYDCWSALKYVNDIPKVNETMSFLNNTISSTSNALAMMLNYDNYGEKTQTWGPPKTERDGFWERVDGSGGGSAGLGFKGGVPAGLKPDVTVCNGGGGCKYATVQEAVNACPKNLVAGRRFVILIKAGVYQETVRIPLEKKNMVFLGDGIGKTVITGSGNVGQPGITTYMSTTVAVMGDGFMASGLTIQNTAGSEAHQAVAFRCNSDLSVIEDCEFLGNQDTLYAHALRQYYKSCRIQGNIDFVFGNSASYFETCLLLIAPRQTAPEKGETNAVTAHGRIDPAQFSGFVFLNCVINGTEEYMKLYRSNPSVHLNYLGRPWKEYSRTVYIQSTLEALISPDGWLIWDKDFALKTLYYGESGNLGSGANTTKRVRWSSLIPAQNLNRYSVQNFIQGNQWIPAKA
ncbi:OLC1v1008699C1 [Oldenlandia corymbosa var. corymbosa]|uniref:pectinesterase n=1 Tax=Oldenlandia corymbosa var. corymbosa TaxID=529605 RepID=A0AAV1DNQ8_OLDCO|nr:OLC1v1008699C1 [Oldenlandia corymbosa var. corymbosa]